MSDSPTSVLRRWTPHLAALVVLLACIHLALWQLDRASEKDRLISQWETAPTLSLAEANLDETEAYAQVAGTGQFDTRRHILLDNQIRNNHPGVHVFTPFRPQDSDRIILVNRGWQPWDRRSGQWPEFQTPDQAIHIEGRVSQPPRVGIQLGRAEPLNPDDWPNLMTYFDFERITDVFGDNVHAQVLLLDPAHPAHFTGDAWRLVNMGPEKHRGYAFQWASIGLAVFLIWLVLTIRSFRRQ
jgi:surfeit locus 1 family protein